MKSLDLDALKAIDPVAFRSTRPFPYANPKGLLTDEGFQTLLDHMPDVSQFERIFGYRRVGGQEPHNRYRLEYTPDTPVPHPWREFIAELCSADYRHAMEQLLGARKARFRMHWHYTPNGCTVSPHTDSKREHGSQLYYFNSPEDWDPAWGGDTLVLDDGTGIDFKTAPALEDFHAEAAACSLGNYSLIFQRTDHSWHAVRKIECPEERLRRVFIIVAYPDSLIAKIRDKMVGKKAHFF